MRRYSEAAVVPKLRALKAIRTSQFLTQDELAALAKVSRQTINRIERLEEEPRFSTIKKLAHALKVKPSDLVGEEHADA